jgi:probable phosphoglycerate mutase
MKITLVRHGETVWNAVRRWQGHAPVPLSERGMEQAVAAAENLRDVGLTRIVSSDLLRARQTAEIINRVLQLPLTMDSRLREVDVGSWQGMTTDEIIAWDDERYQSHYQQTERIDRHFPDGESYRDVQQRAIGAIQDLMVDYGHVLVVTHGGVIHMLLNALLPEKVVNRVENCSLYPLTFEQNRWIG